MAFYDVSILSSCDAVPNTKEPGMVTMVDWLRCGIGMISCRTQNCSESESSSHLSVSRRLRSSKYPLDFQLSAESMRRKCR